MEDAKREVTIARSFPAGINRLWDAFSKPEDMLQWWSPVGMTTPSVSVDFQVGGNYAITMEYDQTHELVVVRGIYEVIDKPNELVFTWKWDGSDEETLVRIEFFSVTDEETRVVLTHSGFNEIPTEVDLKNNWTHDSHKAGWTSGFDKLAALVSP